MNGPDEKVCEGRIQDAVPEAFTEPGKRFFGITDEENVK
jgi:hypothetical protein